MADKLSYSVNNKEISFTTKSIKIDGKEYFYKNITAIKHSSAKNLYLFKVEGKWHELYYDEANKKSVATIFKKIYNHLVAVKSAEHSKEEAATHKEQPSLIQALEETAKRADDTTGEESTGEKIDSVETEEAPAESEEAPAESEEAPAESEEAPAESEEAPAESEEAPAESEEAPAESEEAPAEKVSVEENAEAQSRKIKFKKSITVFAIIIALFIVAGVVYYFTIGLPTETTPSDGQDTHQYNDIQELIDEMQE